MKSLLRRGALGQAAPRVRLGAPGDAAEQELLVVGSGRLAQDLAVLFAARFRIVRLEAGQPSRCC
jgi:hypothetical protein